LKSIKLIKTAKPLMRGVKTVGKTLGKNSNWIFAALGMVGLAGTAWQMVDATVKAVKLCEEKQVKGTKEVIKTVWKLYIPGLGFVLLTTLSIAGHTRINHILSKKLVKTASVLAASQMDLKAVKEKAAEMLGEKKAAKITQEVDQDNLMKVAPPNERDVYHTGHGDQLFKLRLNGGYFRANKDWVILQIEKLNKILHADPYNTVRVSDILDTFGQEDNDFGYMEYSLTDMLERGYDGLEVDISECHWDPKFDSNEVVCIVHIAPAPDPCNPF